MRRILAAGLFLMVAFAATPGFAQDAPQEEEKPVISEKDVKKLRSDYSKLTVEVKVIQTELKGLNTFKGKDKDLEATLKRLKKSLATARKLCASIAEKAELVEWSKAPKLAVRISGEVDTLASIADSLKAAKDLNTSIKGEIKQSNRALEKDLKKLGQTPPVSAQ